MSSLPIDTLGQALGHAISDKRLEVLRRIGETGSISQAARDAGISYKAAWQALDTLTNLSGQPLVERTVGGQGGGGARLTPEGEQLLVLADAMAEARQAVLQRFGALPPGGQVAADTPLPTLGGLGLRTSMRNQLACTVVACEQASAEDPMVAVRLRTRGAAELVSVITWDSADLLALSAGTPVLVLCKATAVTISAGQAPALGVRRQPGTCLEGRVERIAAGARNDEVVLALEGGDHWVGFAAHPCALQPGDSAVAFMAAAALVIAHPS